MGALWNNIILFFQIPIFNALIVIYNFVHDYGLAIIIMTLLIRLIMVPLTLQQLKSSKAMQEIQPKLKELQQKHKNNREQLAKAQMDLYKEHNVNPAAGCLPLVIQLPFLFGLFAALRNGLAPDPKLTTAENLAKFNSQIYPGLPHLNHLPNIDLNWFTWINPHWVFNLAQPDPTHILPILAAVITFIQMRMSITAAANKASSSKSDSPQTAMMGQMAFVAPIITGFFAWQYAAGLALYWVVSVMFSVVQQYFITGWGSLFTLPGTAAAAGSIDSRQKGSDKVVEGSVASSKDSQNGNRKPSKGSGSKSQEGTSASKSKGGKK